MSQMCATILPDLTYQFGSSEYLAQLDWQGELSGVHLEQVHGEEALFELRSALAGARKQGSATLTWQPRPTESSRWLQIQLHWNSQANSYLLIANTLAQAAEQTLSQQPVEGLFDYSPQGIMVMDRDNRIYRVNRSFYSLTGYRFDEVVGQGPGLITNDDIDPDVFEELWQQLMKDGVWEGELWNCHKDGRTYPAWYSILASRDSNGEISGFVAQFSDTSSWYEQQSVAAHLHDAPELNRLLEQKLQVSRLTGRGVALLMVDLVQLDNKELPDYREQVQDLALRLASELRDDDFLAFTASGGLALIVDNCGDPSLLESLAQRLLILEDQPMALEEKLLRPELVIGGALSDSEANTAELLQTHATLAMQSATMAGGGFRLYEASQGRGSVLVHAELEQLIETDGIELRFNPVYSLRGHQLIATEVVPCLQHPQLGVLPADKYLPQLTRYGLLQSYHQQLQTALVPLIKLWSSFDGFESIYLRLQDEELFASDLIAMLLTSMRRAQIPSQSLMVAVTTAQLQLFPDECEHLKAQGVRLLVDCRGKKRWSLMSPRPDMLLLDAGRVEQQMRDDQAMLDVERLISQARDMGLEVMAEGVRTTGQMTRLTQQGCFRMNGRYVGQHLTMSQLIERLDMEN
ncbi:MAG: EAL domain-containing protein [Amphritea sp.]|nr:EAL domain-containing protein [Amphritea sp.]